MLNKPNKSNIVDRRVSEVAHCVGCSSFCYWGQESTSQAVCQLANKLLLQELVELLNTHDLKHIFDLAKHFRKTAYIRK